MIQVIFISLFSLHYVNSASLLLPSSINGYFENRCNIQIPVIQREPIVVNNRQEFLYREPAEDSILLDAGEDIIISCPGGILEINEQQAETVDASCSAGTDFSTKYGIVDFNTITCSKNPFHTARRTGQNCEMNGEEIEIGFVLDTNRFVRQIRICFDPISQNPLYSTFNLTRSIEHHESNVSRPYFIEDDFYNVGGTVNNLFLRGNQRATINQLVGLPLDSSRLIQNDTDYYLARGHLSAKADFVYAPQQRATFHYVNVAPQWQTFNGGNWAKVEMDVRNYAQKNRLDLVVYTGTYGVTTLTHVETGEEVELYLYVDGNKRGLPVPKVYWKVVYNPATNQGVALIGVNNPYLKDVEDSILCSDVSSQIDWLTWKPNDLRLGYSYACAVDDLRNVVPHIPEFPVDGLLV